MGIQLSSKPTKTYDELVEMGNVKIPVLKRNDNFYQMKIEELRPTINFKVGNGYIVGSPFPQPFTVEYYGTGSRPVV